MAFTAPTSAASMLTTELNSLADDDLTSLGSAVLDNTTNRYEFAGFSLALGSAVDLSASTEPGYQIFLVPSLDSTGYDDGPDTTNEKIAQTHWKCTVGFSPVTAAQRASVDEVPIGPYKYKAVAKNKSGAAAPASGNILSVYTYGVS